MTTLVFACYRTLSLTDSERVCAGYHIGSLRVPTDLQVTIVKGGAVDKSEAFAPMYPQFVMRNSDLRSSCESSVRLK